jgi:acetyl esterase/lipase
MLDVISHDATPCCLRITSYFNFTFVQIGSSSAGNFRTLADNLVKLSCPMVGLGHWQEIRDFIELSTARDYDGIGDKEEQQQQRQQSIQRGRRGWRRRRITYGDHKMQHIDLFLPSSKTSKRVSKYFKVPIKGTIFFIHGGAWGSGHPWMYRLVAPPFLQLGFAVAIVGYRTYPDVQFVVDELDAAATQRGGSQVGDVRLAWEKLGEVMGGFTERCDSSSEGGWVGNIIMGHSSGAHVALILLVDMIGDQMKQGSSSKDGNKLNSSWIPNFFVGLSGPYDISYHFDYEAGRGVEQISPMKPICGHSRENFQLANPTNRLLHHLTRNNHDTLDQMMPPILLVHGIEDTTVPFTATSDAARQLRACGVSHCNEIYLERTSHQDVILHFMMGGAAKELVLDWLFGWNGSAEQSVDGSAHDKKVEVTSRL